MKDPSSCPQKQARSGGERVTDRRGRVTWLEAAGPLASPEGAAGWAQEGNSLDLTEPNNAPPHRARARPRAAPDCPTLPFTCRSSGQPVFL